LRRGGRDQPAIVADRYEDTQFHGSFLALALHCSGALPCYCCRVIGKRGAKCGSTENGASPERHPAGQCCKSTQLRDR
jgi:hypothetical protein